MSFEFIGVLQDTVSFIHCLIFGDRNRFASMLTHRHVFTFLAVLTLKPQRSYDLCAVQTLNNTFWLVFQVSRLKHCNYQESD